ncbi:MAG: formate--tetrahydrofolate ligase [Saprospiraceae bacterium]|nr:formate--tetrahydrofolate ligase [Saprospiraceae bacterium]
MTDLDIARSVTPLPIADIAALRGIPADVLEPYGRFKAKLPHSLLPAPGQPLGKLILVSAISPTPAGEGKTTVTIGLTDALNRIGKKAGAALREPSLGPVFGIKGGATGGGYAQVIPMEDINLHFTGDITAVERAHNLLAALIDNRLHFPEPGPVIDPRTVLWKRVMDLSDRSLRRVTIGLGGPGNGVPRETGFDIAVASEVMAILCLTQSIPELKERLGRILIGFGPGGKTPVYAGDLQAAGAMAALLKDALQPNLVQTLERNPAILHGGPFANIAQGTNSILATRMALGMNDYVVTEAGFGFDLGGEKFIDIKCREAGFFPHAVVLVATVRALKYHGGAKLSDLKTENLDALRAGFVNLARHVANVRQFGIAPFVAINRFAGDTEAELALLQALCADQDTPAFVCEVWARGGAGAEHLAEAVAQAADASNAQPRFLYEREWPVEKKIETLATEYYGAGEVDYSPAARMALKRIKDLGLDHLLVCMAKTQKSISDNPRLLGAPSGYTFTVNDIEIAAGAGFVVPIAGEMLRMPGLPVHPAAEGMDLDAEGRITGLF